MTGENVTIIVAEKTTSRFHQMQYKKSFKSQMVRMKKVAKRKTHKKLKENILFLFQRPRLTKGHVVI